MSEPLSIAVADRDGVATMLEWAAAEGWNPGLSDASAFHAADPDGFLLGSLDGTPVGGISLVRYGPGFGFLGLYIVRPEHRGRGHGMALWHAALARRGGRTVGLDGVVERQADYRRSGFVLVRRNVRYTGPAAGAPDGDGLVPVASLDPAALSAFDRSVFPADRRAFIEAWVRQPGAVSLAVVEAGEVRGYGVVRPCRVGAKIGPLFAVDEDAAERLFVGLSGAVASGIVAGGGPVTLDVPESNAAAVRLATRHGLEPAFETARMYLGPVPDEPVGRILGVTTFELG